MKFSLLAAGVLLALPVMSSTTYLTPSITVERHQANTKGPLFNYQGHRGINVLVFELHGKYKTGLSETDAWWMNRDTQDEKDQRSGATINNYRVNHTIGGGEKSPWQIGANINKSDNVFNIISNSLMDELYATNSNSSAIEKEVTGEYSLLTHDIDRKVTLTRSWRKFSSRNDEGSNNEGKENRYDASLSVSRMSGDHDIYWQTSSELSERSLSRFENERYRSENAQVTTYIPISGKIYANGLFQYSDYEFDQQGSFRSNGQSDNTKRTFFGGGLTWLNPGNGNFLSIGRGVDNQSDDMSWYTRGRINQGSDFTLSFEWGKMYFGRSTSFELVKNIGLGTFSAFKSQRVDVSYISTAESIFEGFVLCPLETTLASEDLCSLPDGNVQITPDLNILPLFSVDFGISPRIVEIDNSGVSYEQTRKNVSFLGSIRKQNYRVPLTNFEQETNEANITLSWALSQRDTVSYNWRFRESSINGQRFNSHDRLHTVTFSRQVNTQSTWFAAIQHGNRNSENENLGYDESRISAGYTYHFGKRNPNRKTLFSK